MGMRIKENSIALSIQAKQKIMEYIIEKALDSQDKLPSESRLMAMLGVSRHTVREALALLEQDHLIYKVQGKGTFLQQKPVKIEGGLENLDSITDMIKISGYEPGTTWLEIREEMPTEDMKQKLRLVEGEKVVTFIRLRTADHRPAVFCVDTIPRKCINGEVPMKVDEESMFQHWQTQYGLEPTHAVAEIIPALTDDYMVNQGGMKPNLLLLLLYQIHYDREGNPLIYSKDYFNPEVIRFKVNRLKR